MIDHAERGAWTRARCEVSFLAQFAQIGKWEPARCRVGSAFAAPLVAAFASAFGLAQE